MSMEFPEEDENREKDYLIAKCSTLRTFMDYELQTDTPLWISKLKEAPGPNFDLKVATMIVGIVDDGNVQNMFGKLAKDGDKIITLTSLVTIGYELGSMADVYLFFPDLYETLVRQEIMRNSYEGCYATLDLLKYGTDLRRDVINDVPDEFKNFTFDLD